MHFINVYTESLFITKRYNFMYMKITLVSTTINIREKCIKNMFALSNL